MWNPFKLRSVEARRLELRIVELEDDTAKLTRLLERIDARGRGRATRESAPPSPRVDDCGGAPCADVPGPEAVRLGGDEAPRYTKEQLRQFARNRGMSA